MIDENLKRNVLESIIALTDSIMFLNEQGYEINQKKWNKLAYLHVLVHSVQYTNVEKNIINIQV